jgi:hypothetical protein
LEADSARSFGEVLQRSDGTAHLFRLRQDELEQEEDEEDDHCDFWNVLALKSLKDMAEASGRCQLGTVGALCLSVISSVAIVICNKALISTLGFTFATTLTSWHLIVTFCSLHVAQWIHLFENKPFDSRTVIMGFGVLNGISIGLLNLCLGFNSVGFYQMSKLAIIPCTVFLETFFFGKQFRYSHSLLLFLHCLTESSCCLQKYDRNSVCKCLYYMVYPKFWA